MCVVWGDDDAWIQLDQPAQLAVTLTDWLMTQAGRQQ